MTSFHIRHYVCSILEWGTLLLPGVWYWWRAKSESIFRVGLRRAGNEAAHDIPKTGLAAPINPHSSSSRFSTSSVFEGICSGLQGGGTVTQRAREKKPQEKGSKHKRETALKSWPLLHFLGLLLLYLFSRELYIIKLLKIIAKTFRLEFGLLHVICCRHILDNQPPYILSGIHDVWHCS